MINNKKCHVCNINKKIIDFYKNKPSKDGYRNNCKLCEKKRKKEYYTQEDVKLKEKILKKKYRSIYVNKQIAINKTRVWYRKNINKVKEYQINNKSRILANNAKRRAKKLNATPKWLTKQHLEEVKTIYKNCPSGYHVDHIVPLQGKTVSGLHVPWNLQYLTAEENLKKSNKLLKEVISD